ncbi:Ig-like domain-containing protein [Lachnoclostridium phytofermentans]|uniref:Ig domain protein group 2 domain protein n=1 Tax=Lachnoclostridium phytofermentans (strain ATCC 700394 / DSM 18823 / ISDg) TaxID=357809 RepID=A9KT47_LACP7|nr:Ig-like domain-containing protein [Lachnoclostridium phytofermentans]ABX42258.1 Ig domain protein group 2 domain protein [Lachnoclostridium phytofermentans ISDg]
MTAKKFKVFFLSLILIFTCTTPILPNQASASSFIIMLRQDVSLNIGEDYQLIPLASTINIPQFKSSNTKVATVSALGKVVAKKPGTAKITVTVGKENATCQITVKETKIALNSQKVSLENGETFRLSATTSDGSFVTYKSSKKSVAIVDDTGLITAMKPGTTTITVSANGTKSLCNITVKKPTIKLDRASIKVFRGQSYTLTASVSSRIPPTYKSNKKSVAIVDSNGTITAMKHGDATITATVDGVSTTCIVTVKQPEISLNQYEIHMKKGERKTLYATVSSGNTPVFTTSNSNVITVDKSGKISAIKKGTAYVYCQEDGVKVKCKVIVSE